MGLPKMVVARGEMSCVLREICRGQKHRELKMSTTTRWWTTMSRTMMIGDEQDEAWENRRRERRPRSWVRGYRTGEREGHGGERERRPRSWVR
ncbi:hypothetical protein Dimus_012809, partial [Dionaea muscipula]